MSNPSIMASIHHRLVLYKWPVAFFFLKKKYGPMGMGEGSCLVVWERYQDVDDDDTLFNNLDFITIGVIAARISISGSKDLPNPSKTPMARHT